MLLLIFFARKQSNKMNHEDVDTSYVIAIWLCSIVVIVLYLHTNLQEPS